MKITLLGTGLMGAPMARHLADTHEVTVWNRNRVRAEVLSDVATVAATPAAACRGAQAVIVILLDGPATRAVLTTEVMMAAGQGSLIINMGSVDPETDQMLAAQAVGMGLRYIDAPVSGGVAGAEAANLAILV